MSYPNFQNDTSPLTYDIETKDPGLKDYGPSNYRNNDGCILGVAFTDGDTSCYVPWTSDSNVEYIKDTLGTKRPKIGHSILYDVDWPESLGVKVDGRLHDTCVAENLINENQDSFALDILGTKYFKQGKDLRRITNWCLSEGISPLSAYDNLWRMPDELVGAYAIQDVNLTHRLFQKQQPVLEMRGLSTLYDMECDLLRVLVLFRRTGVRYDKELSLRNSFELIKKLDIVKDCLEVRYNNLNPNSSKQVGPWFDKLGIDYPLSPTGLPSIKKELLEALVDADETGDDLYLPRLVLRGRTYSKSEQDCLSKLREDFVCPDGKIHCSFHPFRFEGYGTRSGRFSSSRPNLQQITSAERDTYLGGFCRSPFIPYPECWWGKIDYSQIEYRFIAHYATGPGSDAIKRAYNENAEQDYHQYIMDRTGLARPFAKNLNFGIAFGMGAKKMSATFGWPLSKCYEVLEQYHDNVPFVKSTINAVTSVAKRRGYIKTILGRHAHLESQSKAYVMFNRLAQGSAADLMKKSMVECYKAGIYDVLHPHLTVHDEQDVSVPKTNTGMEAFKEMKHIMETCIDIKVPIFCDASYGNNWADLPHKLESAA